MSTAKRILGIEEKHGMMDLSTGSTTWTIDADHMENLDAFVKDLREEFGEIVKVETNENDQPVVSLVFEKTFNVYVVDKRCVRLTVQAKDEEEAQHLVEASDDAEGEFNGKTVFDACEWYVDDVKEDE